MNFAEDIADDFESMDGTKLVTVTARGVEVEAVAALRRQPSYRDLAVTSSLGLEPGTVIWELWVSTLDGNVIRQGDVIDDDGEKWTVHSADLTTLNTRYRCRCTRQR